MGLAFVTTLIFLVPTTALGAWVASQESLDIESTEDVVPVAGTFGSWSRRSVRRHLRHPADRVRRLRHQPGRDGSQGRPPARPGRAPAAGCSRSSAPRSSRAWPSRWRWPRSSSLPVVAVVAAATAADDSGLVGALSCSSLLPVLVAIALVLFLSDPARLRGGGRGAGAGRRRPGHREVLAADLGQPVLAGPRHPAPHRHHRGHRRADPHRSRWRSSAGSGSSPPETPRTSTSGRPVIAGVSGLITGALTTPFTAGVDALLYVDQRIRREGFDVQLIAAAQADAARQWPGAAARR